LNYGVFLGLIALLPFPQIIVRYACLVWFITWALEFRWLSKPDWRFKISVVLFGLWYAWKLLSGLWAPDHAAWAAQMERYLPFLFLVPVGIWGVNPCYDMKRAGRVLVISCLCAVPLYALLMTTLFYHREIIDTLHWEAVWNYAHNDLYAFVTDNISNVKHRLYLCTLELFGAYAAFVLYRHEPKKLIPMLVVMLLMIALTDSRQAILTALILAAVTALLYMPEQYRKRYGVAILAAALLTGGGLLCLHPRMQHMDLEAVRQMQEKDDPNTARLYIWTCALQEPKDYLAHGLGAGQSTPYLVERYEQAGFGYCAGSRFHCHNQYLQELMEIGIGGLLLFLLAWVSVPLCARGEGRRAAWVLVTVFGCNMLTDCMFNMFCGVSIWATAMVGVMCLSLVEQPAQVRAPRTT
jgi:O-antigen ligase